MRVGTIEGLRSRAIFAISFLGALRADTIISLRLGDIDQDKKIIVQDGVNSRTKNGKSLLIKWFPIPESFEEAVVTWVRFMDEVGFDKEDALFHPLACFENIEKPCFLPPSKVEAMTTTHAVNQAFHSACLNHHTRYNPNSAKHTIAAERVRRQLTSEQRKAWSLNMGHEKEQTTERYYGKLNDDRRFELLEGADQKNFGQSSRNFTKEEFKELIEDLALPLIEKFYGSD